MARLHRQPICVATALLVPMAHFATPPWLGLDGVPPCWAVLWLLPWCDSQGAESLKYADEDGDKKLSLDEWMEFFMGFWRFHPQVARGNVAYLMNRAAELRMMPALPPGM